MQYGSLSFAQERLRLQSSDFTLPCSMALSSAQDRLSLHSNAFTLLCNMALSSAQDRLSLQSNAFTLSCSMALFSAQDKLGLVFSCHVGSGRFIYCVTLGTTYTLESNYIHFKIYGKIWRVATYTQANMAYSEDSTS